MKLLLSFGLLLIASFCYGDHHGSSSSDGLLQVNEAKDDSMDFEFGVGVFDDYEDEDEEFDDDIENDEDNEDDEKEGDEDDEDDEDEDEEDDHPTQGPMQKHQCMKKFWLCKKKVAPRDCAGKLKCFEEKSECYKAYKANQPQKPKNAAKSICKNTFNTCFQRARPDVCNEKLMCYIRKQKCYMRLKTIGRRHHRKRPRHHHRRRHRHHRRRPCPKKMKCMLESKMCFLKAHTCTERLACMWRKHECMKQAKPTEPPTGMESEQKPMWKRRWNPKIMAKCKNGFEKCINESTTCSEKTDCFIDMKICFMTHKRQPRPHRHFPMPSPQMIKCKLKWRYCSMTARNCSEELSCMWRKHKCMERAHPTEPPAGMESEDKSIWRRKWDPKIMAKCKNGFEKCINKSTTCSEKMECFIDMKICFMINKNRPKSLILRRFPMPDPEMMKCKLKWKHCTMKALNCSEKLTCMWRKHECLKDARTSEPPTSNGNVPESRRRWNPKIMEECLKELKMCINNSTTCQQKMKCFWGMKKCVMSKHPKPFGFMYKVIRHFKHIPSHITGMVQNVAKKINGHKQVMAKILSRIKQRRNNMMNRWKKSRWGNWRDKMRQMRQNFQKKIQQHIKMRKKSWQNRRDKIRKKFNRYNHFG